jgi:hypothetical protein
MSNTHTEDQRGAATMIQAAARGLQGRTFKARVERGGEGAAAVFDAFTSVKIPTTEEVPSAFTGVGAVYMSARGSFGEVASLARKYAGSAGALVLFLLSVGAAACVYYIPQFLSLLFGSIFEKVGAGSTATNQLTGYALSAIGGAVLLLAAAQFVSTKLVNDVAVGLKARATEVNAAHTKMISHAEHENLVAGSVEAGRVLYVCMPAAVCALVVLVASAAHVFTVASSMGFVLVGLVVFRVVMAGAHDAISLESFDVMGDMKKSHAEVSEKLLAGADDQLHADLVYSMESYVSTKNAAQMGCNIAKAVSNIAAAVAIVCIAWIGSTEQRAGAISSNGLMVAVLYSLFAVGAGIAFDSAVRDACMAVRKATPIASFVSRTASATAAAGVISDTSYGAAHVASRARVPLFAKALALFGVLATVASMIAASRSMPTTCAELKVTCVLMDGHSHIFNVPQTWSLVGGCAARQSSGEMLDACLAGVSPVVVRAQQHTCALNSESVEARVTWMTPQGHRAGHRIKEPCTRLDLCAGVSCPAIDECHTDGVCVASTSLANGVCGRVF